MAARRAESWSISPTRAANATRAPGPAAPAPARHGRRGPLAARFQYQPRSPSCSARRPPSASCSIPAVGRLTCNNAACAPCTRPASATTRRASCAACGWRPASACAGRKRRPAGRRNRYRFLARLSGSRLRAEFEQLFREPRPEDALTAKEADGLLPTLHAGFPHRSCCLARALSYGCEVPARASRPPAKRPSPPTPSL